MNRIINIGIDLGTTNTLCCLQDNRGKVQPIKFIKTGSTKNNINLPSVIFHSGGKTEVGRQALQRARIEPEKGYISSKTELGSGKSRVLDGKVFTPIDAAACILSEVKSTVENLAKKWYPDDECSIEAVITHPAYFSQSMIDDTEKAGQMAGLKVKRLISEPMAAALAYISDDEANDNTNKRLLAVDLGGGTFDLSLLQYDAANETYNAIDVGGDPHLGGDDFDKAVLDGFIDTILFETNDKIDLSSEEKAKACGIGRSDYLKIIASLRVEAEALKIELSGNDVSSVQIDDLLTLPDGREYSLMIDEYTQETFNDICQPLYDRIFDSINKFCKNNNITADNIWHVALVGGSCNIPYINDTIQKMFPGKVFANRDLSSLVATGAYLASLDLSDEYSVKFTDTLAHSLGIQVKGERFSEILSKQPYPCKVTMPYETTADHQRSVSIDVYETKDTGEDSSLIDNCNYYVTLELDGLEDKPAGEVKINVTLEYNESRILTITAEDPDTGLKKAVSIKKGEARKAPVKRKSVPMDIMLLIDKSGSMRDPSSPVNLLESKLDAAKSAATKLITEMIDLSVNRMGILSFGNTCNIDCPLSSSKDALIKSFTHIEPWGQTKLHEALTMLPSKVFNYPENGRERWVIIITDGHPDAPDGSVKAAADLKKAGIKIITIGVGMDEKGLRTNKHMASKRSSGEEYCFNISNMSQLTGVFKEIIGELQPARS